MYDITNFDGAQTLFCAILLRLLEAAMCLRGCTCVHAWRQRIMDILFGTCQ